MTSQIAASSDASIRRRAESRCGSARAPGVTARSAHSAKPSPLTPRNAGRTPTTVASAPSAGPSSAPKTAAPIAVPISAPRRPGWADPTSQASAPAHENALPKPCASRAAPSAHTLVASPKPRLAAAVKATPTRTARLAPKREAANPPGTEAASTPTAYAAESAPAPLFDSP